jgi:hypothetical protein
MHRPDSIRSVLASVLLSLTMLTACSAQGPRHTPEQHESAGAPAARPESTAKENLETAGAATATILVIGLGLAAAALPIVLLVLLL